MIDINLSSSNLTLSGSDGAMVIRPNKVEVYVPDIDDEPPEDDSTDPLNTVNTIAFLMYALDRSDWFAEFASEIEDAYKDYHDEMQKEKAQTMGLKLIKGGKDS